MKLENVESELRARGLLLTTQRRAILQYLSRTDAHPTAAQVHEATGAGSLSTVYNTLALLQELGLLREMPQPGGESRYDPNVAPHHHLLCTACGRLSDIAAEQVQVSSEVAFHSVQVHFMGRCPSGCASA